MACLAVVFFIQAGACIWVCRAALFSLSLPFAVPVTPHSEGAMSGNKEDTAVTAAASAEATAPPPRAAPPAGKRGGGGTPLPQIRIDKGSQQFKLDVLPAKLGRYLLVEELGAGSVGVVYEGIDKNTDRAVAVKVMQDRSVQLSDADNEDWARQRRHFFDEARACGRMSHSNILQVIDMGIEQGLCFIATELVPGATTLKDLLDAGESFSCEQVAVILHRCAGVLDHMHQRQVVHRDIKPENILLPKDRNLGLIKLADFGIAHMAGEDEQPQEILGSPRYMSPEQLQGLKLGAASDFFSLGVMAYELLSGQHPFKAEDMKTLCRKIISSEPESLTQFQPDLPLGMLEVINGCMRKDPSRRLADGRRIAERMREEFPELGEYDGGRAADTRLLEAMRKVEFFGEFEDDELEQVAAICLTEEHSPGSEIIEQGSVNDSFFVILDGDVLVQRGSTEIGRLGGGACFGEMGYLTSIQRTATVLAVRKTTVVKFNVDMVSQLRQATQLKFCRAFIRLLVDRLAQTTAQLSG